MLPISYMIDDSINWHRVDSELLYARQAFYSYFAITRFDPHFSMFYSKDEAWDMPLDQDLIEMFEMYDILVNYVSFFTGDSVKYKFVVQTRDKIVTMDSYDREKIISTGFNVAFDTLNKFLKDA